MTKQHKRHRDQVISSYIHVVRISGGENEPYWKDNDQIFSRLVKDNNL